MTCEPETIPGEQVRSAFQRWKNLEEEKARISEDLKELFAEQKAFGHDTKAMRAAFRLKVKLDEARPEDAEHEALVDTYLAALNAPRASRAYAREKIEKFDREGRAKRRTSEAMDDNKAFSTQMLADGLISEEAHAENVALSDAVARKYGAGVLDNGKEYDLATGEILEDINPRLAKQIVDGMQTGAGRAALITAVDIMIERVEAEEKNSPETATRLGQDVQSPSQRAMAGENLDVTGGESAATNSEPDRSFLITPGEEKETASVEADTTAASGGEGASKVIFPAVSHSVRLLRSNCQHPAMCRSGTRDHCWSCKRAMQEGAA